MRIIIFVATFALCMLETVGLSYLVRWLCSMLGVPYHEIATVILICALNILIVWRLVHNDA